METENLKNYTEILTIKKNIDLLKIKLMILKNFNTEKDIIEKNNIQEEIKELEKKLKRLENDI